MNNKLLLSDLRLKYFNKPKTIKQYLKRFFESYKTNVEVTEIFNVNTCIENGGKLKILPGAKYVIIDNYEIELLKILLDDLIKIHNKLYVRIVSNGDVEINNIVRISDSTKNRLQKNYIKLSQMFNKYYNKLTLEDRKVLLKYYDSQYCFLDNSLPITDSIVITTKPLIITNLHIDDIIQNKN